MTPRHDYGRDPALDEADEREWAGMTDGPDDGEPWRTPPRPEPPTPTPAPETPRCARRRPFHGATRMPTFCLGEIVDGRCTRCMRWAK